MKKCVVVRDMNYKLIERILKADVYGIKPKPERFI